MLLIFIISIIIYVIAAFMIYYNLYNYDKPGKIKLIALGFIVTFILTTIICYISSSGINTGNANYLGVARNTAILLFAPINAIISLPYIGSILNKYREKRINEKQLKKRLLIFLIALIIILIIEISYIKDFQIGLLKNAIK